MSPCLSQNPRTFSTLLYHRKPRGEFLFELPSTGVASLHFSELPQLLRCEEKIWAGTATLTSALVEVVCIVSTMKPACRLRGARWHITRNNTPSCNTSLLLLFFPFSCSPSPDFLPFVIYIVLLSSYAIEFLSNKDMHFANLFLLHPDIPFLDTTLLGLQKTSNRVVHLDWRLGGRDLF